jgi:hypothetical protein
VDKVDNLKMSSVDALAEVDPRDPQTYDITLSYPDLFPSTPSDRESELRALELASQLGMPHERIIRELSRIYQMDDTEQFALESRRAE